jgi:hypothetical protein
LSPAILDSIADAGRAHLEGIRDRQRRPPLQRSHRGRPKLMFVIERIENGWGVALADTAMDAD